jgi:hypothetical protein
MNELQTTIAHTTWVGLSDPEMQKHVQGFVRTNRGSYVRGLDDLDSTIQFLHTVAEDAVEVSHDEINAECPGAARGAARYFRFDIPENCEAHEGVLLLGDFTEEQLGGVSIRRGDHGLEFIYERQSYQAGATKWDWELRWEDAPELQRVHQGWIIIGPSEHGTVVYTWYPGRMTAGTDLSNHAVKTNF